MTWRCGVLTVERGFVFQANLIMYQLLAMVGSGEL